MEIIFATLKQPFTWGLLVGLIFAAWAFFSGWGTRRALRRQVAELKAHAVTANDLAAEGTRKLQSELAELKTQNENLRISLAALKDKPDRAELRQLRTYDKAVHLMYERAPGFAPAWEGVMKEAEADLDKISKGFLPWVRRIVHPSLASRTAPAPAALPSAADTAPASSDSATPPSAT